MIGEPRSVAVWSRDLDLQASAAPLASTARGARSLLVAARRAGRAEVGAPRPRDRRADADMPSTYPASTDERGSSGQPSIDLARIRAAV